MTNLNKSKIAGSIFSRLRAIFGKSKHDKKSSATSTTSSCFPTSKRSRMAQQEAKASNIEPQGTYDQVPRSSGLRFSDRSSSSSDSESSNYETESANYSLYCRYPQARLPVVIMDSKRTPSTGFQSIEHAGASLPENSATQIKIRFDREEQKYLSNVYLNLGNDGSYENVLFKGPVTGHRGDHVMPNVRVRVRESYEPCQPDEPEQIRVELNTFKLQTTPTGVEITKKREVLDKKILYVEPSQRRIEHIVVNPDYVIKTALRRSR